MSRKIIEMVVGTFFFVAFIGTDLLFGITAAVRVLGVACAVEGAICIIGRSIPVGFEGRPPSFFLVGAGAVIAGVVLVGLGVVLLLFPEQAGCFFSSASGTECSAQ